MINFIYFASGVLTTLFLGVLFAFIIPTKHDIDEEGIDD